MPRSSTRVVFPPEAAPKTRTLRVKKRRKGGVTPAAPAPPFEVPVGERGGSDVRFGRRQLAGCQAYGLLPVCVLMPCLETGDVLIIE